MKRGFYITAFHIVCWVLVALPAVVFVPHNIKWSGAMYAIRLCLPAFLCTVFYLNYLWLVPNYWKKGRIKIYIVVNIIATVGFALCMECLTELLHIMEAQAGFIPPPPPPHTSNGLSTKFAINTLSMACNVFPFLLSAALATSLRLAMRWQEAEAARREMEIQKTEAELNNLRTQINPHFLLNTLNNIYALISFDTDKARRAVMSLGTMMRQMLYGGRDNSISLADEADFIKNYVDLMKLRLGKNVRVSLDIQVPSERNASVAPFIFISLVENAFKHGVSPTLPSFVKISLKAEKETITCEISNTNYPKGGTDRSGHGIGLEQVAKRLALAYPDRYKWEKGIDSNNVYHSKITIYDTDMRNNRR